MVPLMASQQRKEEKEMRDHDEFDLDVRLTPTEFDLLRHLMYSAGKVVTHRSLLRTVWGPEYGEEADYLRVYIRQLRRKAEAEPSHPQYIHTESGVGYCFRPPGSGNL